MSEVVNNNRRYSIYPIIKPKYYSFPLMTNYLLLKQAADDDPFALHELGLRYLLGYGFKKDTLKAVDLVKRAVDKNLTAAKFNYAILLNNGIGVEWNPFEAFNYFELAAKGGMPEGQFALGVIYTDNLVVPRNYTLAAKWIKKAAEANYEPAIEALEQLIKLGIYFEDPKITEQNDVMIVDSVKIKNATILSTEWELNFIDFDAKDENKDSEREDIQNILQLNKNKLLKKLGVGDNFNEENLVDTSSHSIIRFASDNGSPEALMYEGMILEAGKHIKKDPILAALKYIKAIRLGSFKSVSKLFQLISGENFISKLRTVAKQKNYDAMYVWAALTALGFDNTLTPGDAFKFLLEAASNNHLPSIIEIGLLYFNGELTDKDKNKALEYWKKASILGSPEAEIRLVLIKIQENADLLDNEIGNLLNFAENGSILAQMALAYCYEEGVAVKKNLAIAAKLYRISAVRGSSAANLSMRKLYNNLRPKDEKFEMFE